MANFIDITPLSEMLGAEISNVNLSSELDSETINEIKNAWNKYIVLLFRSQSLTNQQYVNFSKNFGVLDEAPLDKDGKMMVDGFPELLIVSNIEENGSAVGSLGNLECEWHTDMSYNPTPPMGSCLYAIEVPNEGGNTGFLNMELAYQALPADLKETIAGKRIKHDATHNSAGQIRQGMFKPEDVTKSPGAYHPIVRTHPETGRPSLFLGRRPNAYIESFSRSDSEFLLDRIWSHITQSQFIWEHKWRKGDVLLWDNRNAMHRRDPFDNTKRRYMHRTQISGDLPF